MIFGVDFDNTLVCYDAVFSRLAGECDVAVSSEGSPKRAVRDALRRRPGGELDWTLIQGRAYGPGLAQARPFPDAIETIRGWIDAGHEVVVISHKSGYPAVGPAHDLHASARTWLATWLQDLPVRVFLETTRWKKLRRIESERCDIFVDDLLDFLEEPTFPGATRRVWISAQGWAKVPPGITKVEGWSALAASLDPIPTGRREPAEDPCRRRGPFVGSPREAFSRLAVAALGAAVVECELQPGGINNLGARLALADGRRIFGKIYRRSPDDPRDRLDHETRFLQLLEAAAVDRVPRVLAFDADAGVALHTLVPGARWPEDVPAPPEIWQQFDAFLSRLQEVASYPDAPGLPLAAEAAVSLQEHLAWVLDRRDTWRMRAADGEVLAGLRARVDELDTTCESLARATIARPDFQQAISRSDMILTPSDFGLHNALVDDDGRLSFVDFEYAGWDDPLKTEIDFAHQPRHTPGRPSRLACLDGRLDRDASRTRAVRELLALKWRYIVLAADFSRQRRATPIPDPSPAP